MPSRRRYLTALVAGFAGCIGESDHDSGPESSPYSAATTPSTDRSPDVTATATPPGEVIVEDVVVRKAVTYDSIMGSGGVVAPDGRQFVVATVRTGMELSLTDFTFHAGDEHWAPSVPGTYGAENRAVAGHEGYAVGESVDDGPRSFLAFELPSPLTAAAPFIQLDDDALARRWELDAGQRSTLARPGARFELDAFEAPSRVRRGETFTVTLHATNVADVAGRFLAAVYWPTSIADDDESSIVERQAAAGEQVTVSVEVETQFTETDDGLATLSVEGHVGSATEVTVVGTPTP